MQRHKVHRVYLDFVSCFAKQLALFFVSVQDVLTKKKRG